MNVGDLVRILAPFDETYPEVYVVTGQNPDTGAWQILDGIDFEEHYLELVE